MALSVTIQEVLWVSILCLQSRLSTENQNLQHLAEKHFESECTLQAL